MKQQNALRRQNPPKHPSGILSPERDVLGGVWVGGTNTTMIRDCVISPRSRRIARIIERLVAQGVPDPVPITGAGDHSAKSLVQTVQSSRLLKTSAAFADEA
jgi:hypothetical protein